MRARHRSRKARFRPGVMTAAKSFSMSRNLPPSSQPSDHFTGVGKPAGATGRQLAQPLMESVPEIHKVASPVCYNATTAYPALCLPSSLCCANRTCSPCQGASFWGNLAVPDPYQRQLSLRTPTPEPSNSASGRPIARAHYRSLARSHFDPVWTKKEESPAPIEATVGARATAEDARRGACKHLRRNGDGATG